MTTRLDDPTLDALLAEAAAELPDAGFTAAVMRRVQADEAARQPLLDAGVALSRLHARAGSEARRARWRAGGGAIGAGVAAVLFVCGGGAPSEWSLTQGLALWLALGASAWAIAFGTLHGAWHESPPA
jgi:hypothetical protein